jgi:uncharacterized membrane protein YfcA
MSLPVEMTAEMDNDLSCPSVTGNLLPVYLNLKQRNILIVGAGKKALKSLFFILHHAPNSHIGIVAEKVSSEVKLFAAKHPRIQIFNRRFIVDDLVDVEFLFLASGNQVLNATILKDAKERNILVYMTSDPDSSDFLLHSDFLSGNVQSAGATGLLEKSSNERKGIFKNLFSKVWIEDDEEEKSNHWREIAAYSVSAFALMLIGHIIFSYIPLRQIGEASYGWYHLLDKNFPWMILAGFLAQLVDGALGMGYGVTSASILLSTGINPAAISGSIHTAEMFASGASGYSHYRFGNVNKKLFKILVIPGVVGAIVGAILLVYLGDKYSHYIRPILAVYTLFLGVKIFANAFRNLNPNKKFKHYGRLAGLGGFLDSFGGGGWGPIVTTTLITKGRSPRFVIGTVSLTEFFVTIASALTFFTMLGVSHWQIIIALMIGSFIAAPIAAKLAGRLPKKISFILLGILVMLWSIKILLTIF